KMVMVSVKSVEACCMEIIQSMANYQIQKKTVSGQLAIVNGMMKQVEKTHQLIYDTFQTLQKLDVLLPTELRLDDQSQSRWSLIQKLFQDAKKGPLSRDV
ncbi:4079_t:CDS:2, partial [Paraglomus occultum]